LECQNSNLSLFHVHVWLIFSGPTEVTVLPQDDYYHPSRQQIPISPNSFNQSPSITSQDGTKKNHSIVDSVNLLSSFEQQPLF
jgi:hypothetical protein